MGSTLFSNSRFEILLVPPNTPICRFIFQTLTTRGWTGQPPFRSGQPPPLFVPRLPLPMLKPLRSSSVCIPLTAYTPLVLLAFVEHPRVVALHRCIRVLRLLHFKGLVFPLSLFRTTVQLPERYVTSHTTTSLHNAHHSTLL